MKYCSNVAQSEKKCLRVLKMQNSAPNSKKCSKGAQRNRERPTYGEVLCKTFHFVPAIIFCSKDKCYQNTGFSTLQTGTLISLAHLIVSSARRLLIKLVPRAFVALVQQKGLTKSSLASGNEIRL